MGLFHWTVNRNEPCHESFVVERHSFSTDAIMSAVLFPLVEIEDYSAVSSWRSRHDNGARIPQMWTIMLFCLLLFFPVLSTALFYLSKALNHLLVAERCYVINLATVNRGLSYSS